MFMSETIRMMRVYVKAPIMRFQSLKTEVTSYEAHKWPKLTALLQRLSICLLSGPLTPLTEDPKEI